MYSLTTQDSTHLLNYQVKAALKPVPKPAPKQTVKPALQLPANRCLRSRQYPDRVKLNLNQC